MPFGRSETASGRQDRRIGLTGTFPSFTARAPCPRSRTRPEAQFCACRTTVLPVLPRFLQEPLRERKDIGVGNVFLVDRTESARSSQASDGVVADGLDLTRLVHQRAVRMACGIVRSGGQHGTVERAQSEMGDKPVQLDEYVETGQVEVSPERTSA